MDFHGFFPSMTMNASTVADREALRRALHSSLSDVLLDVGAERRATVANDVSTLTSQILAGRMGYMPNANQTPSFDTPSLPSRLQSLFSQSIGFPQNHGSPFSQGVSIESSVFHPSLVAVAAHNEEKALNEARAILVNEHIAREKQRILIAQAQAQGMSNTSLQNAYWNMIRDYAPPLEAATLPLQATATVGHSLLASNHPYLESLHSASTKATALEALGSNLREKTDPYIDVSNLDEPDPDISGVRRARGGVSEPFPERLHRMLTEVEEEGLTDIVSFYAHGRAFGVHDNDRFVREIMPKYFNQSKWNSFARQLNLYGFIRITSGPDAGGYYHELFLKGKPNLCLHMRRVGVPRGVDRRKLRKKNVTIDPDFYSMKSIEP